MTGSQKLLALCLLLAAPLGGVAVGAQSTQTAAAPGADESEGIIFERQQIMMQLGRDSELLSKIAARTEQN